MVCVHECRSKYKKGGVGKKALMLLCYHGLSSAKVEEEAGQWTSPCEGGGGKGASGTVSLFAMPGQVKAVTGGIIRMTLVSYSEG